MTVPQEQSRGQNSAYRSSCLQNFAASIRMGRRTKISLIVLAAVAVSLGSIPIYYLDSGCTGDILWNDQSAYLFIGVGRLGYRLSYLEYPLELFREYFGIMRKSDDKHYSTIVFQLTPSTVREYDAGDISLNFYTPIGGNIYANKQGELWKWCGTHFEKASKDEQQRLEGTAHLVALPFTNVNGWSARYEVMSRFENAAKFDIELDGKAITLLIKRSPPTHYVSVDLAIPGHSTKTLWSLYERPRRVNKMEYERSGSQ